MRRWKLITLIGGLAIAWPLASFALQPKQPLKRVGVLPSVVPCPLQPDNIVVRRLGELGWIEGQTVVLDCVSALGHIDQVPALARELVLRRPDVLIAAPFNFVSALKQETTTTPIIMLGTWEPVRVGLITSLAQPGGNVYRSCLVQHAPQTDGTLERYCSKSEAGRVHHWRPVCVLSP